MGNICVRCYLKMFMGCIVLRNIYPSAWRVFEASKVSQKHFPLCSGSEVPWKLPQIFMSDKHWCIEGTSCSCEEPAPQREMTLCHTGATQIYTPVPGTSNKQQQQRGLSLEKSHLCPQAPLSSTHLPAKTSEPRPNFKGLSPHSASHIRFCTRAYTLPSPPTRSYGLHPPPKHLQHRFLCAF